VSEPALLEVQDLAVSFATDAGRLVAVDGIDLLIPARTTVALVGESGCGKSVTAMAIMRLLPTPPATIDRGRVLLSGRNLLDLSEREMRKIRGAKIGLVFQDPTAALDPVYRVGTQLIEAFRLHQPIGRRKAKTRALELLRQIGFPDPEARFGDYPHQLSGGMRQRIMIAIALACDPALVIADEPTTSLDMLAATQIANLLDEQRRERDMSLLLISHDIGMVSRHADRIVVLYAGQVVESGRAKDVLGDPQHPYTQGLLASIPPMRKQRRRRRKTPTRLPAMSGSVPDPLAPVPYCRFTARCPHATARCGEETPPLYRLADDRDVRCFLHDGATP
jgi:peptide/nickel transport system ATP-binding protein